jgi:hypothetical protein
MLSIMHSNESWKSSHDASAIFIHAYIHIHMNPIHYLDMLSIMHPNESSISSHDESAIFKRE